jgi:hypothetical protein
MSILNNETLQRSELQREHDKRRLAQEQEQQAAHFASYAEAERVNRWHATRDAVLGHLYAADRYNAERFSAWAREAADIEHGPLVKP